jgi:hypothetical protein
LPPTWSGCGPAGASSATPIDSSFLPGLSVTSWVIGALLFELHARSLYLPGASRRKLKRPWSSVTTYAGAATTAMYALMFACRLQPSRMMPSLANVYSRASPVL